MCEFYLIEVKYNRVNPKKQKQISVREGHNYLLLVSFVTSVVSVKWVGSAR